MPEAIQHHIEHYADVINSPRIGCDDNYAFTSWQFNPIAEQDGNHCKHLQMHTTPTINWSIGGSARDELDNVGDTHMDNLDAVTAFSVLMPISDLLDLPDEDPGVFQLPTLGFYIKLDPFSVSFFLGRIPHKGTAPLAPTQMKAPSWAIRGLLIGYPSGALTEGRTKHAFAAIPYSSDPLCITPEMTGIE